jgi:hypothetical protein
MGRTYTVVLDPDEGGYTVTVPVLPGVVNARASSGYRPMPVERRVRHALDVAHAFTARRRTDQAVDVLLRAERLAPEQVRYHAMSRQLVMQWLRRSRGAPSRHLGDLARRMKLVA